MSSPITQECESLMTNGNIPQASLPDQKELEKELADYLSRKYGERVKIVSTSISPQAALDEGKYFFTNEGDKKRFEFKIKPEELVAYLDEYVVKQDEAKTVLSTKICTHFNRIRYFHETPTQRENTLGHIKSNVLLIGPTGVGKTYLIKLIAKKIGVPFVKGDATKFSETGYVGGDVEDLVRDLVREAGGDLDQAQYGIIYVDEIDKIASSPNRIGADVSRTGVQRALLKPMEETEVDLKVPHDPISQIEAIEHYRATGKREKRVLNTKNILFIMSGAFNGLDEIIRKRVQQQSMGFEGTVTSKRCGSKFLCQVKAEDLIEFGFESEFVGRLPVVAVLEELTADDLYGILRKKYSSQVIDKKQDFRSYGIHILFEDKALRRIAELAHKEQTGARGLMSVMEKVLLPFERRLPSTAIKKFAVTETIVNDPAGTQERYFHDPIVQRENLARYEELYQEEFEEFVAQVIQTEGDYLKINDVLLTPARLHLIAHQCQDGNIEPRKMSDDLIEFIAQIKKFAQDMSQKCQMDISFSEEAVDLLLTKEPCSANNIKSTCDTLFSIFEYGFSLMHQKKGRNQVTIPAEGVDNPKQYIDDLVAATFKL